VKEKKAKIKKGIEKNNDDVYGYRNNYVYVEGEKENVKNKMEDEVQVAEYRKEVEEKNMDVKEERRRRRSS
jgi:hypothetical protein